jgi:hypothetical protein
VGQTDAGEFAVATKTGSLALPFRESKGWYRFQLFQMNFVMLTIFYYSKPKNKAVSRFS